MYTSAIFTQVLERQSLHMYGISYNVQDFIKFYNNHFYQTADQSPYRLALFSVTITTILFMKTG